MATVDILNISGNRNTNQTIEISDLSDEKNLITYDATDAKNVADLEGCKVDPPEAEGVDNKDEFVTCKEFLGGSGKEFPAGSVVQVPLVISGRTPIRVNGEDQLFLNLDAEKAVDKPWYFLADLIAEFGFRRSLFASQRGATQFTGAGETEAPSYKVGQSSTDLRWHLGAEFGETFGLYFEGGYRFSDSEYTLGDAEIKNAGLEEDGDFGTLGLGASVRLGPTHLSAGYRWLLPHTAILNSQMSPIDGRAGIVADGPNRVGDSAGDRTPSRIQLKNHERTNSEVEGAEGPEGVGGDEFYLNLGFDLGSKYVRAFFEFAYSQQPVGAITGIAWRGLADIYPDTLNESDRTLLIFGAGIVTTGDLGDLIEALK